VQEPSDLRAHPGQRVAELVGHLGKSEVVAWCADLVAGATAYDDPSGPSLAWLGGRHALVLLEQGDLEASGNAYWPRVWGARGLLYAYEPAAAPQVVGALHDGAWRVREMAAKVVARWEVADAADALGPLLDDGVTRVRAAAVRALGVVGEGEHADAVRGAGEDPEPSVRRAAATALAALRARLDRDL